jgi:hypothetical protein
MANQKESYECHYDFDHWRVGPKKFQTGSPKPLLQDSPGQVGVVQKFDAILKVVEYSPSSESEYDFDHWRVGPKISRVPGGK